ncbi:amidohydrolase [Dehalococcoides mccartyi]|nr:amidohydrolase [Dehalococcoides mccartyi]
MIIDWNIHMFSSDTERYPFHSRAAYRPRAEMLLDDPVAEYMKHMEQEGIDRAVLVHPEPYGDDHRLALDCVAARPDLFKTTALFYPKDDDAPSKLKALAATHSDALVGFRFHAHEGKREYLDSFSDSNVRELWKTAGELGLIIELHIGPDYSTQVAKIANEFPDFTVLIDHMAEAKYGSGPDFSDTVKLGELDNVYMKLSGLNHYADDEPLYESVIPFSRWVADSFGPDRMVWGSGSPSIVDAQLAHWSESDRAKVKGGNLQRLLGF